MIKGQGIYIYLESILRSVTNSSCNFGQMCFTLQYNECQDDIRVKGQGCLALNFFVGGYSYLTQ